MDNCSICSSVDIASCFIMNFQLTGPICLHTFLSAQGYVELEEEKKRYMISRAGQYSFYHTHTQLSYVTGHGMFALGCCCCHRWLQRMIPSSVRLGRPESSPKELPNSNISSGHQSKMCSTKSSFSWHS